MSTNDYTSEFVVSESAEAVYATIVAVRDWWGGEIEGHAEQVGDVFTYRFEDLHFTRQRVSQLVPGRTVVWHVEDGAIHFVTNKSEWDDTDVIFDILPQESGTAVRITHRGLVPQKECFEACSAGWNYYFGNSLKAAIEGAPLSQSTESQGGTADERRAH